MLISCSQEVVDDGSSSLDHDASNSSIPHSPQDLLPLNAIFSSNVASSFDGISANFIDLFDAVLISLRLRYLKFLLLIYLIFTNNPPRRSSHPHSRKSEHLLAPLFLPTPPRIQDQGSRLLRQPNDTFSIIAEAGIEAGVVCICSSSSDEDGVVLGSQKLSHGFGFYTGEGGSLARSEGDLAIEGLGVGECHVGDILGCLPGSAFSEEKRIENVQCRECLEIHDSSHQGPLGDLVSLARTRSAVEEGRAQVSPDPLWR